MKDDFGVTPRRSSGKDGLSPHFTDLTKAANQPRVNVDKYRPASHIEALRHRGPSLQEMQAVAFASELDGPDPLWRSSRKLEDLEQDNSGSQDFYPDEAMDEESDGNKTEKNESEDSAAEDKNDNDSKDEKPKRRNPFKSFVVFLKGLSRKQWLIIGGVILILIAGLISFLLTRPDNIKDTPVTQKKKAVVADVKPTSPLTGIEVSEEDTKRPVIGVMIENSTFARPQSGLQEAGVVYEAIAEYGITRFLALYQEASPGNIGPVRSARPYYVDWAHSYDAGYAHVGGSPDALNKIKAEGIRDLDQFANAGTYRRISQREAPHNVHTTGQQLRDLMNAKGFTESKFNAWPRKKEAAAKTPTATGIDIAISGPTYNVHYDYDAASNSYLRTMGGAPHTDADSGARIAPKVVIGLVAPYSLLADGYHSAYVTVGSGTAKIFQDGTVTEATWKREGNDTYQFFDAKDKPIKLNPGQAWITVVGAATAVTSTAPAPPAATPAPAP